MAKGNLLLGMSRGKIGDIVVTRGAGEQVARARNRNPKNPRTNKQMAQRAALATVVEFFTRGKRNLFKFAFESKRKGESDYNAFVRANINRVPMQSRKTLVENGSIFGGFVLSQGSLTAPLFTFSEEYPNGVLSTGAVGVAGSALTIGKLSQLICDINGLENGDIITIVAIASGAQAINDTMADAVEQRSLTNYGGPDKWTIRQFTLDVTSTVLASTLGIFDVADVTAEDTFVPFAANVFGVAADDHDKVDMMSVIASRNTSSGLKVSTSQLAYGEDSIAVVDLGMSDDWKIWVAKHWNDATSLDVAPDNILEGSISEN